MINNLNDSKYLLRDGVLYKSCPSCSRHSNQDVYYPCPRCFGYRHDNERRPFIQSLCYNCRGSKGYNGLSDWYAFEQDDDIIMSSIRVLPTSKEVFPRLKDIKEFLTIVMPNRGNTYYYKRHNLSVDKNALILFQYNNQIIAYGIYESECSINESDIQFADGYTGYYKFKDNSIKILEEPIISKQFYELFGKQLSQATLDIKMSHLPVLMDLLNENQEETLSEEEKQIDKKVVEEITDFAILGIHEFNKLNNTTNSKDYIRAHKNQMAVGSLREEIVYNFEKEKLTKLGLKDKAKEVKAVSGDSTLGYDILSFNENGDEIHIEVKSKSGNISYLDFYISDNEYEKLNANENHFVYYISNVRSQKPKLFKLNGKMLKQECVKPVLFRVSLDYEE